jgi:hypothetical protein
VNEWEYWYGGDVFKTVRAQRKKTKTKTKMKIANLILLAVRPLDEAQLGTTQTNGLKMLGSRVPCLTTLSGAHVM